MHIDPLPKLLSWLLLCALVLSSAVGGAQTGTPPPGPLSDTSVIDADGTAHIARVVPLPATLSAEARGRWSKPVSDAAKPQMLAERRTGTDTWQTGAGKKSEHPYPAALDDVVAVYKDLLKTYKPEHIAIYGSSAGAILTGEVAVRLKELGLPEPGALGIFSGFGDMTAQGESSSLFTLEGFPGHLDPPKANPDHHSIDPEYTAGADPRQTVLSPNYSDLHGLPPTLFITSSRDILLSGTSTMERAWLRDSVESQLVVFDGLPHAFWNDVALPESREAYATMARFFLAHTGG